MQREGKPRGNTHIAKVPTRGAAEVPRKNGPGKMVKVGFTVIPQDVGMVEYWNHGMLG